MSLVSTQNSRKNKLDYLILATGIIFFLVMTAGSLREYRRYRQGVESTEKIKEDIKTLQGRKERLEKQLAESQTQEFVDRQLREKLGLVRRGEENTIIVPTIEPRLVDLIMPDPPPKKLFWREWLELLKQ